MTQDELALRFRQWVDRELAYLARVTDASGDPHGRNHVERVALRRAVAWIESAADVPMDERLVFGGVRRDHARSWKDGVMVATARQDAAELEGERADGGCEPCPDELDTLAAMRAGLPW